MKEISVRVFDDLDYTRDGARNEAAVTITVGLDGTWRELDLTKANEQAVRDMVGALMDAGRKPEVQPVPPEAKKPHAPFTIDPARAAFFKGLREWVHITGQRNSAGTGWAYQTNESLKHYYSEPLKKAYQAYLDEQAGENDGKGAR